ncbi:MAG: type II toxin-antitoxin system PemK/MazF family toxin [Patescibacteria group bacterium]
MSDFLVNNRIEKDFFGWAKLKPRIHYFRNENEIYFKTREIWWASLGINIGYEQDGKHDKYERPVLILRKFGGGALWVLPLTSKNKLDRFYYNFRSGRDTYSIILSQLRLISSKRLSRKIMTMPEQEFWEVIRSIKNLL